MLMLAKRFFALFLVLSIGGQALAEDAAQPIRALLVTGGGWYDFETQKKIITEGLSERIHIEWTVDYEAGRRADFSPTRFEDENWIDGFDIVIHNHAACSGLPASSTTTATHCWPTIGPSAHAKAN